MCVCAIWGICQFYMRYICQFYVRYMSVLYEVYMSVLCEVYVSSMWGIYVSSMWGICQSYVSLYDVNVCAILCISQVRIKYVSFYMRYVSYMAVLCDVCVIWGICQSYVSSMWYGCVCCIMYMPGLHEVCVIPYEVYISIVSKFYVKCVCYMRYMPVLY